MPRPRTGLIALNFRTCAEKILRLRDSAQILAFALKISFIQFEDFWPMPTWFSDLVILGGPDNLQQSIWALHFMNSDIWIVLGSLKFGNGKLCCDDCQWDDSPHDQWSQYMHLGVYHTSFPTPNIDIAFKMWSSSNPLSGPNFYCRSNGESPRAQST